jgi:hypothetical protein
VDFNKLIARAKAILLTPKTEWPVIAGEPATAADLYKNYIVILAAIPAIFGFIKFSVIGISIPFAGTVRLGVGAALTQVVLQYILTLVMVFVMALIIDALAPTFGGQKDQTQALKTVTYAYTASWVAGIAQIIPGLWVIIAIVAGIYSIYLLYLGLPQTMKCPPDKAAGYTAVVIIVAIVLGIVVGMVVGAVAGTGSMMRGGGFTLSNNSSDVKFDKDSPLGQMEQYAKNVEKAGKQMESAQNSGNPNAQADAFKAMMGAAMGGGNVEALAPDRLKPFIPETLGGMPRTEVSVERNNAMGMQISEAKATYANEGRSVRLEITDTGTAKGLLAFAGWAGLEGEKQSSSGYEKTYRSDGRLVHEQWSGSSGEYTVVLGDRFTVELRGDAENIGQLKAALGELDLAALEALKAEGVKAN